MHRKDARVLGRIIPALTIALIALVQIGCSGSTRIKGRVITGPVGLAVIVDPTDERLANPGVPGVEVAMLRESASNSGSMLMNTTTDEEGNFSFSLARGQHPGGAVIIRTRGPGIYTARSRSYLPKGNQVLLCTVMPQPATATTPATGAVPDPNTRTER
ncbi:hypothetical protein [Limnoraphis robusta]|uniref:Carboxypeptidase regulatory-like domain-containing protein n=1 Tax=Limnoraphis robusta CCNP1315 TaxID=3110306 RepID=A0ABU5U616_9CYAN|nr:hypothetical protein [Limnoraphis robusta]MEA5522312.1 hypothetical protein [Limnoraphis robusta CCNP1315]